MNSASRFVRGLIPSVLLAATGTAFAQAPVNDNFVAATPLAAGAATAGTNVNATVQAGEPPTHWTATYAAGVAGAEGVATGKSVWFSYSPAETGLASFSVVAQGTGTAAVAMQGAAYSGTALNNLVRIASASSTAGAAGTAGIAYPSNLFTVTAGARVFIQITGNSAAGVAPFDVTVSTFGRTGSVVLPRYSSWEWLHPVNGVDPTASPAWAATWRIAGDPADYGVAPGVLKFSAPQPAPLGFDVMEGAPGVKSNFGAAAAGPNNNAAYARTIFTLANDTSNLWAEVAADDGAYIYIDDHPGAPINIASRLSDGSFTTSTGFYDFRPQPDVFLTGAIPAAGAGAVPGCRAYLPAGFNAERKTKMVYLSGLVGQLSAGSHQIAVSVHQTGTGSSDMAFDLQLLDMGGWPLAKGSAGITFTGVPVVPGSGTTAVVPAVEHHFAPTAEQAGLAWYCVSPDSSTAQACVIPDTAAGLQNALRINAASDQRFVTEPVKVDGLPQFVTSLRIRTDDTSSGFEAPDGFRVFLETSDDGINFAEPAPPLEVQPQLNDDEAYTPFSAGFVTKALSVVPNPYKFVRMVITGTADSTSGSESIYFDDINFSLCQLLATTANLTYNHNGDNDRTNDTVSFELTVSGSGAAAVTWTTSGFGAGSEVSGTIGGPAVFVTRPAVDAAGARQNVVFTVADDGNPACFASVTVTTPAAAIGNVALTNPVRSPGADPASTADDTFTYSILVDGTATGLDYEIRSSDTGNTTLYGTGIYGVAGILTLPATVATVTIKDNSVPALLKTAALPPPGADLAMGRTVLNGADRILYSNPAATGVSSKWTQASGTGITPPPADLGLTVTETTTVLHPGAAPAADEGVLESPVVDITGIANVVVSASLRAFESSTGSGFEAADTFKIEVIEDRGAGDVTVNLITGHAADISANDLLNGFTGTAAAYDGDPAQDEFNAAAVPVAGSSRGTFPFAYAVPADVIRLRVRVTGANDSPNEYFFLQNLIITDNPNFDSEPDGLADAWEILYFGNLTQTGAGDSDGDGQTNSSEQAAGTAPSDGTSVLAITLAARAGNLVDLTFNSVAGKKYIAQSSPGLTGWADLGAEVTAGGSSTTIFSLPDGGDVKQYFRVRLVP